MPQWRKLYSKVVESVDVNAMPDDFTRLLWVLLPTQLCREGRGQDHGAWVRAKVFPLRDDVTLEMIEGAMAWYAAHGMIVRYQVDGRRFFQVTNWHKYQGNTSREMPSDYPPPPAPAPAGAPAGAGPTEADGGDGSRGPNEVDDGPAAGPGGQGEGPPDAPGEDGRTGPVPGADRASTPHAACKSHSRGAHASCMSDSRAVHASCVSYSRATHASCMQRASPDADADAEADAEADAKAEADAEGSANADAGASGPEIPKTFQAWHALVTTSKNPNAKLRWMIEVLFPGTPLPSYQYIGRAARQVGGPGRLADLLWQAAARPPTGDLLRYCQGMAKGGNGRAEEVPDPAEVRERVHEILRERYGE
jgi:hypothetical protein